MKGLIVFSWSLIVLGTISLLSVAISGVTSFHLRLVVKCINYDQDQTRSSKLSLVDDVSSLNIEKLRPKNEISCILKKRMNNIKLGLLHTAKR